MFDEVQLARVNGMFKNTMMETLGIVFVASGPDEVAATMPVEPRTHQPMGLLHGGATVALADALGSAASYMLIDGDRKAVLGIEVNANHLRTVRSGLVKASGRLMHRGRTMHVWDIRVADERERLVAVCRHTVMIIDRET